MQLVHITPKRKGKFILTYNENTPDCFNKMATSEPTVIIALNGAEPQKVCIEGICRVFPPFCIISLVSTQQYNFEKPQTVTAWQYSSDFYSNANCYFEVNCLGSIIFGFTGNEFLQLDQSSVQKLEELRLLFIDEFETADPTQTEMLQLLLRRLLILTTRLAREQYQETAPFEEEKFNLIRQFSILVNRHFKTEHQVQFYAEQLHKTPKNLTRIFNSFNCGKPSAVIQNRLISEAKEFLCHTPLSIKEIAFELGFKDANHFSRFFKKATRLKPSDFRKQ